MAQQIVVCFDGTWNDPTASTNVHRLFDALSAGPAQRREWLLDPATSTRPALATSHLERRGDGVLAFCLEGIGATGLHESRLESSDRQGTGLHRRLLEAYLLLSRHYAAGDALWLFGGSRGAWSARSLAGLLARAGLMTPAEATAPDAFDAAQQRWLRSKRRAEPLPEAIAYWQARDEQPVRLVGVWDTVGALGVPRFNGLKPVDQAEQQLFDFADLALGPRVQHGRQALAIDENRHDFEPAAWQPRSGVRQMWFAGAHADVAGGEAPSGLSDLALQWMLDEARALGLPVGTAALPSAPDALQDRHDESRRPLWRLRPVQPRAVPDDAELHPSVFERLQHRPDWRPAALRTLPGLAEFFRSPCPAAERLQPLAAGPTWQLLAVGDDQPAEVRAMHAWNATGARVRSGERFTVTVLPGHDTWHHDQIACGPEGHASTDRGQRWAEGARRLAEAPWFTLVAAVHASPGLATGGADEAGGFPGLSKSAVHGIGEVDAASQLVPLGREGAFEAACDGYLYLFANDVAWAYGNNQGGLRLVVHRIA
jgi:uncharacterized protein (DUF2235 family)